MSKIGYIVRWLLQRGTVDNDDRTTPDGYEDSIMAKYMNSSIHDQKKDSNTQVAVLLVFHAGVTKDEVTKAIATLPMGILAGNQVKEFTGDYPVIYFP
jgi:hypothetical protein